MALSLETPGAFPSRPCKCATPSLLLCNAARSPALNSTHMLSLAVPIAYDAIKWGKRAYNGYKALKAVADKANSFRRAPTLVRQTCGLCSALLEPMAVAEALAVRHEALHLNQSVLTWAPTRK